MISHILFDLDGVLFDGTKLHKFCFLEALNGVITSQMVTEDYHDIYLNGLSTKQKLNYLLEKGIISKTDFKKIEDKKKEITNDSMHKYLHPNTRIANILEKLQINGYKLYCVTNSIYTTVERVLQTLNIKKYFTDIVSSDNVENPKPSPEPYITVFKRYSLDPNNCLILEDSYYGRISAYKSLAHVLPIVDSQDLTYEKIINAINLYNANSKDDKSIHVNIVVPMAGHGSRFSNKGYTIPKPFIPVFNKTMIEWVIENILPSDEIYDEIIIPCKIKPTFHFIAQKAHLQHYDLAKICRTKGIDFTITTVDAVTEGPACTVLLTKEFINNDCPLITINSDQYLDWDINEFYRSLLNPFYDGCINTFYQPNTNDLKWSYAKTDSNGFVLETAEKKYIGPLATTGIYGFRKGSDFVKYAEQMIFENNRTNNEFYVAPVYNYLINNGGFVRTHNCKKLWGLGVPEDLEYFLKFYIN